MGEGIILKERISKALKVILSVSDVLDEKKILATLKWLNKFPVKNYITDEFKTDYQSKNRIDFVRSVESFISSFVRGSKSSNGMFRA